MVDKLEVKKHVSKYLKVANVLNELTDPCIIKATNDSGGYKIIKDGKEIEKAPGRLTKHRFTPYGVDKGEWWYGEIPPRYFIEEFLPSHKIDYQFHCLDGKSRLLQVRSALEDRDRVFNNDLVDIDTKINDKNAYDKTLLPPENYERMKWIAEELAAPFKYVRVDLFNVNDDIYFGEMTFAPAGGKVNPNITL